jgi:hypothetical protein
MSNSVITPTSSKVFGLNSDIQDQNNNMALVYSNPNTELINKKAIRDSTGRVFFINNQGVATYVASPSIYNEISGKRGMPGTGNYNNDEKSIETMPFKLTPPPNDFYDRTNGLYMNGYSVIGQSTGDETNNIFGGLKSPISFNYAGCTVNKDNIKNNNIAKITVTDVSYGLNCATIWKPANGNKTQLIKDYISKNPGKSFYNIGRNVINFGDPYPGCNKNISITYQCDGKQNTISRTDGKFDSGYTVDLSCPSGPTPPRGNDTLTKCYYDALSQNKTLFGLGNVNKTTGLGTCYVEDTLAFSGKWQNPGRAIWKIDIINDLGYKKDDRNQLGGISLGRDNNVYFNVDGAKEDWRYSFFQLCKFGKLNNKAAFEANVFNNTKVANNTKLLFLSNGNLYLFDVPGNVNTKDITENPDNPNYLRYMIYSSGTRNNNLAVGWDKDDIARGYMNNIIQTTPTNIGRLPPSASIYSKDGKLKLTMNPDYTLVLYTGDPAFVGCGNNMENKYLGYDGIAYNKITGITNGQDNYFGKLAYVNRLGSAYLYTDPNLYSYTDKYSSNPGFTLKNISGVTKFNDANGFIYNNDDASIDKCQSACNASRSCIASVIDNKSCYLPSTLNPTHVIYKNDAHISLRIPEPIKEKVSSLISTKVNTIDTNKFANYSISSQTAMNSTLKDFSFVPQSMIINRDQKTSQLINTVGGVVKDSYIVREGFTPLKEIYEKNTEKLNSLDGKFNNYSNSIPPIFSNMDTLNKMVSNSNIHMRYMNIMYSILFIVVCIILIVAFTISL